MPHGKFSLPPLTARLEFLSKPEKDDSPEQNSLEYLTRQGEGNAPVPESQAAHSMKKMERAVELLAPKFPRHLQLAFAVYRGGSSIKAGELVHQMDIRKDRYVLRSVEQAADMSGLRRVWSSAGKVGEQGLQPELFEEEEISLEGKQAAKAAFRRKAGEVQFSQGGQAALPDDAQDALSFMYQLSQLSMQREIIPMSLGDGAHIEGSPIEIGGEEIIDTPMGKVRALHLRKMHDRNQPYFEIWLGTEYRLLPVKFRRVNEAGETVEEFVISEIRASDD